MLVSHRPFGPQPVPATMLPTTEASLQPGERKSQSSSWFVGDFESCFPRRCVGLGLAGLGLSLRLAVTWGPIMSRFHKKRRTDVLSAGGISNDWFRQATVKVELPVTVSIDGLVVPLDNLSVTRWQSFFDRIVGRVSASVSQPAPGATGLVAK